MVNQRKYLIGREIILIVKHGLERNESFIPYKALKYVTQRAFKYAKFTVLIIGFHYQCHISDFRDLRSDYLTYVLRRLSSTRLKFSIQKPNDRSFAHNYVLHSLCKTKSFKSHALNFTYLSNLKVDTKTSFRRNCLSKTNYQYFCRKPSMNFSLKHQVSLID